ncbi:hypothetical protein G7Y79_00010g028990 [Physcia stellaris]|nr:hypothetical protein G7Y79_00010g028990 [Physcia stellaris]
MGAESHIVSWQSAFWGTALIALNSITQDIGGAAGISPELRAGLASSPWFCAFDSLDVVILVLSTAYRSRSIVHSLRHVAKRRMPETKNNGKRGLATVFALRVLLPLTAVLQYVKVMGFQGLPWSQAYATMFMINFLLNELLGWMVSVSYSGLDGASSQEAGQTFLSAVAQDRNKLDTLCYSLMGIAQISHWFWITHVALTGPMGDSWANKALGVVSAVPFFALYGLTASSLKIICYVLILGNLFVNSMPFIIIGLLIWFLPTLPFRFWGDRLPSASSPIFVLGLTVLRLAAICSTWVIWIYHLGFFHGYQMVVSIISVLVRTEEEVSSDLYRDRFNMAFKPVVALILLYFFVLSCCALIASAAKTSDTDSSDEPEAENGSNDSLMASTFLLMSFIIDVVYYRWTYDPSMTYRPQWTESLG